MRVNTEETGDDDCAVEHNNITFKAMAKIVMTTTTPSVSLTMEKSPPFNPYKNVDTLYSS